MMFSVPGTSIMCSHIYAMMRWLVMWLMERLRLLMHVLKAMFNPPRMLLMLLLRNVLMLLKKPLMFYLGHKNITQLLHVMSMFNRNTSTCSVIHVVLRLACQLGLRIYSAQAMPIFTS